MSITIKLHQLEDIDISLAEACRLLEGVKAALEDRSAITRIEAELESQRERLFTIEREKRDAEIEIQDLEAKVASIKTKLDSGTIRNPKELVNLDKELHILEAQLREKDESALSTMEEVDRLNQGVEQEQKKLSDAHESFTRRKVELEAQQKELEKRIISLQSQRDKLAASIAPDKLDLYQMLRSAMSNRVVVGVQRGFCLGCRIQLPLNEMRNLEHGEIVRCSSCGRILYMT